MAWELVDSAGKPQGEQASRSSALGNFGRDALLVLRLFAPYPRHPLRVRMFSDDPRVVALALAVLLACAPLADYMEELGHGHDAGLAFNVWGLYAAATWLFAATALIFLLALANARLQRLNHLLAGLLLVEIARTVATPLASLAHGAVADVLAAYCIAVLVRLLYGELDVTRPRRILACAAAGAALWAMHQALPANGLFKPAPTPRPAALPALNVERVYLDQERLVQATLDAVRPSRADVVETYFVGFAPYAAENVFRNEVEHIEALFRERLAGNGYTALLVNSRETVASLPLANGHNLAAVLAGIGAKMGDEDVLYLHMTSHGGDEHALRVDFENLGLNDLDADTVGAIIDAAQLPWRVVVVSACYSGGFIEPLKSPRSLVMTASAAKNVSFGCEHGREFTYFGEALYQDNLSNTDYRAAFDRAAAIVREREQREGLMASEPQFWIGDEMAAKLARAH